MLAERTATTVTPASRIARRGSARTLFWSGSVLRSESAAAVAVVGDLAWCGLGGLH